MPRHETVDNNDVESDRLDRLERLLEPYDRVVGQ
jgi:hypothetical protein